MGTPLRFNMILPNGEPLRWGTPGARWGGTMEEVMAAINQKNRPMAAKNVTFPVNEVLGMCAGAQQMLTDYKTDMTAAGVDPTALITKLGTDHDTLAVENDKQENLKTQERAQTAVVENVKGQAYADASNACDMVIAAFGKTSPQAREAMNLRKSVRPDTRQAKQTPPPAP